MYLPSGDHVGAESQAVASVSRRGDGMPAVSTYRLGAPERVLLRTTERPSGDHAGSKSYAGASVSCWRAEPSAPMTKTSPFVVRPRWSWRHVNAIAPATCSPVAPAVPHSTTGADGAQAAAASGLRSAAARPAIARGT